MIKLNVSQLPPDIANLLMLRGAVVPPLLWLDNPNKAAKDLLEQTPEDTALFRLEQLVDESMASAVRALLYLLNGWRTDCDMYAQAAPEQERLYIEALSLRQAGSPQESKNALQQLDGHPIYEPLAAYVPTAVGASTDRALNRFQQITELGESWEPFAFADLFEQARAGKLCSAADKTIRELQCREFELLLAHCYEAATGVSLPEEPTEAETPPKRPRRPRKPPPKKRSPSPLPEPPKADGSPKEPERRRMLKPLGGHKPGEIGVLCPSCKQLNMVTEQQRGTKHQCPKCLTEYLVPKKATAPAAPQ